jgi:replicative DNA helicase
MVDGTRPFPNPKRLNPKRSGRADTSHRGDDLFADILDRQPPSSVKTEQCLLGSLLLKPDVCDDVASIVLEQDFYDDAHRLLFHHMMHMYNQGRKLDISLLAERLKKEGALEQIGGLAYLGRLAEIVPHAAHATDYAHTISDHASRRELIDVSTSILQQAYESPRDTRELVNEAEQRVFSIIDSRNSSSVISLEDMVMKAVARLDAQMRGEHAHAGISTGFADLDKLTGGLHPGEFDVLAARPGMGKTALALNIAKRVAIDDGIPVLFVSLEMAAAELVNRLLCAIAEINSQQLRIGSLGAKAQQGFLEVASEISTAPLFVDDSPSRTVLDIAAAARRVKRQAGDAGLGLVVIDYLQLIEPDNPRDPRQEQVAKIARRLKGLARELSVPVLCLAQLNRQTEATKDNRPRLSHLRESGAIEQDADVVMFVHREEYFRATDDQTDSDSQEGRTELILAKQRNGPTGTVHLLWQRNFMRFVSPALRDYGDPGDVGQW